ncbi:conserved hypothetical protein [Nostocoides japonicum T1-X7]|uniref:Carbohydrate kinase PfkB domain-containing protein n=1 Tax=Nostocoides japonicum T1-X7 TaxID=1194083 RepID=A0A077M373_9MICO|nr:PfkB family carbohydrate kinase [Tetrasphaera japonica]CCH78620.1 conserved hypothetical protein [Tetrasphaera japonica T1-X7]
MVGAAPRVATIGDNVVDRYVERGVMFPGGNAVNVAVHIRRLGVASTYVGAVGTDHAGRVVLDALRSESVDTTAVRVVEGPNAAAEVRVVDGNRVFGRGTHGVSVFDPSPEELALLTTHDIVHTGECSDLERHLPDLQRAARLLSYDFSERPWDYVEDLAPHVDLAILSLPHGRPDVAAETAERVRALGPRIVVVTLGATGALLHDGEIHLAPAGTGPIVDTLGAGDALIARLLVGLSTGEAHEVTLRAATEYASATCATFGAFGHEAPIDGGDVPPAVSSSPTTASEGREPR